MIKIKNILYLGWLGKGNVGDDVLFELFKILFYKYSTIDRNTTAVNIDVYPMVNDYKIKMNFYDLVVLGGGSLIHLPYWLRICKEAIHQDVPVVSWGTGFDGYFKSKEFTTNYLKQNNLKQFADIYNDFTYLSVRGPYTKKIMMASEVNKGIHEIGDPALLYADEVFESHMTPSVKNNKQILINWGTSYNHIFGYNELQVEQELVDVTHQLLTRGYTVRIYPIWTEDIPAVKRLATKVNDDNCTAQTVVLDAKALHQTILNSYFSINLKLHANIFAASANKPFISLAYRGKCFDFAQTVQCLDYTIATDEVNAEKIMNMVDDITTSYNKIVKNINHAKEIYRPELIHSIQLISEIL